MKFLSAFILSALLAVPGSFAGRAIVNKSQPGQQAIAVPTVQVEADKLVNKQAVKTTIGPRGRN